MFDLGGLSAAPKDAPEHHEEGEIEQSDVDSGSEEDFELSQILEEFEKTGEALSEMTAAKERLESSINLYMVESKGSAFDRADAAGEVIDGQPWEWDGKLGGDIAGQLKDLMNQMRFDLEGMVSKTDIPQGQKVVETFDDLQKALDRYEAIAESAKFETHDDRKAFADRMAKHLGEIQRIVDLEIGE